MPRVQLCHRRGSRAAAAALLVAVLISAGAGGCGVPPEFQPTTDSSVPGPGRTGPTATPGLLSPTVPPFTPAVPPGSATPSPTGFPESYAVDCGGRPSGAQVVRVLRGEAGLLPASARASVDTGPLCSGSWQYTVVSVPGREPLAVVTRGRPGSLRLVTAGTSVCSIPVRTLAPPGIRAVAACDEPGAP